MTQHPHRKRPPYPLSLTSPNRRQIARYLLQLRLQRLDLLGPAVLAHDRPERVHDHSHRIACRLPSAIVVFDDLLHQLGQTLLRVFLLIVPIVGHHPLSFSIAANARSAFSASSSSAGSSFAKPPAALTFWTIASLSAADPWMSRINVNAMLLRLGSFPFRNTPTSFTRPSGRLACHPSITGSLLFSRNVLFSLLCLPSSTKRAYKR